jgi:hypothetical protein
MLGHLLEGGVVAGEEAGRLTVTLPAGNAFVQDRLREPATRELLVEVARRLSPGLRDVVLTNGGAGAGATAHPTVQAAMALFDGEVTMVRPAPPRPEREDR